jgi:hypothetical protein
MNGAAVEPAQAEFPNAQLKETFSELRSPRGFC